MVARTEEAPSTPESGILTGLSGAALTAYLVQYAIAEEGLQFESWACSYPFCFEEATKFWFFFPFCEGHWPGRYWF